MEQTLQLLDYIATQEEAVLTYSASDMQLAVHSDASYLSEPQARSRAGGHFFLSNEATIPANNGAVLNIAHIIKHVVTSATEAELAALYIMAQEAVYIRIVLTEKWATSNLRHHCKQTTPQRRQCATARYNLNEPKQWTWDSIGYETDNAKSNSEYIGDRASPIMQITGWNITQQPTTNTQEKNS